MSKLSKETKKYCLDHAREDEVIVIPRSHDSGLDEYIEAKLGKVYESLNTRKRIGECHLELTYPEEEADEYSFSIFKESPDNKAKDRRFCGLFTVDISSYINSFNSDKFDDLISYTKDQLKDTTILFVVSSDMPGRANGLTAKLSKLGFLVTELPNPSAERIFEYAKEVSKRTKVLESRRTEVVSAVEDHGFEIVDEIIKAVDMRKHLVFKKKGNESGSRFGY